MSSVVWTARALTDLRHIRAYIAKFNPHAAASVAASLLTAGESLSRFPERGRVISGTPPDMRELIADYRYVIRYQVIGDEVVILRVRHGARRPTRP